MKIHVLFSPNNVEDLYFAGKTTVVIDVLRATSVIVTALSNKAKEIIPVNSVEFAMKVSGSAFGGQTLLGGERNTIMIDGFNLGNSPLEYTADVVGGKSIILYTSNGSKAIVKAKLSENLLIASFFNLSTIAKKLVELDQDVVFLCSGSNGMFCLEDTVCAGKLISEMATLNDDIEITDAVKASIVLAESFGKSIHEMLLESEHGKLLVGNGFEDDVYFCSKVNTVDVVPYFDSGVVKLQNADPDKKINENANSTL